jgi:hypothetical protein
VDCIRFLEQFAIYRAGSCFENKVKQSHVFVFNTENPLHCTSYEYSSDVAEGQGREFRVFVGDSITRWMLEVPASHGLKELSDFSMEIAKMPKSRRDYIAKEFEGVCTDEELEWYRHAIETTGGVGWR